jgi:glucokinase
MTVVTLGLDVGGTKVAGGLITRGGTVLRRHQESSLVGGRRDPGLSVTRSVAATLIAAASDKGLELDGTGAGFPEYVTPDGMLASRLVIDWDVQPTAVLTGPLTVDSDVRCAARGEACFGHRLPDFLYVSVGTGISSCLIAGGVPVLGVRGEAIGLGELPVAPDVDPSAGVSLEQYASGEGMRARYAAMTCGSSDADLPEGARPVLAAADAGEPLAIEVVTTAARALAAALGWLTAVLDPAAIVMGGGLADVGGCWGTTLDEHAARALGARPGGPPLLRAALGADAGIIGAAVAHRARARRLLEHTRRWHIGYGAAPASFTGSVWAGGS